MATNSFYCWLKYLVMAFTAASFLFLEIDMSEVKFTKGEWKVERFVNNKGFEISFNDDGEVVADYVYEEADAHLIAAAPSMYAALESILMDCDLEPSDMDWVETLLAKARGE